MMSVEPKSEEQGQPRAFAGATGSGACCICGKSPCKLVIYAGVFTGSVSVCSEGCSDEYSARRRSMKRQRVTGFPGHNRGKKFVRGVGYVRPPNTADEPRLKPE